MSDRWAHQTGCWWTELVQLGAKPDCSEISSQASQLWGFLSASSFCFLLPLLSLHLQLEVLHGGKSLWIPAGRQFFQFSCLVMSNFLRPHGLQHTRLPCPSPTPRACSNSWQFFTWHLKKKNTSGQLLLLFWKSLSFTWPWPLKGPGVTRAWESAFYIFLTHGTQPPTDLCDCPNGT